MGDTPGKSQRQQYQSEKTQADLGLNPDLVSGWLTLDKSSDLSDQPCLPHLFNGHRKALPPVELL